MKTLIKDGRIVAESGLINGDILIKNNIISDIGRCISTKADLLIDAGGKFILPGGVDQHVHFGYNYQGASVRGFETSAAAIAGGTTTIADFVDAKPGESRLDALYRYERDNIAGIAACDYVLHINLKSMTPADYVEMEILPEMGVSTVNLFMSNSVQDAYAKDNEILKVLDIAKKNGITALIHAENCDIADFLVEKLLEEGKSAPYFHTQARPVLIEEESTARICCFSEVTGAPVMITHLSSQEAVESLKKYRARGNKVYGETCPHYLVLDERKLAMPDFGGAKYVCNPPLRSKEHQRYLWQALKEEELICVGTDHCAFDWNKQKKLGLGGHHLIPKGIPGLQDRLSLLWTYGVVEQNISLTHLVNLFSTNPAKVLGIYPQKGVLRPGSDADIVIYDAHTRSIFSNNDSLHGIDYNAYEGINRFGMVNMVFLRGQIAYSNGYFENGLNWGRRVMCSTHGLCYK